ncbi:methyl-accepting chemotaxis protein [Metabacillus niabensis]|uniref:Methyl-accepting chemotaxis protein n=1 Tax=Metabacillus niabensis TaxID=324854 RepID=A0ABT9Z2A3_9BACI|nr:methyl-accepting chemotaxis protein [Metabacillus niabensis]MDQ0226376.1 methyl-accepting chemotaxis protein [Metabacillus niabensis]
MKLLKNLKISYKIVVLIIISLISLLAVGTIGFVQIKDMGNKLDDMYTNKLQSIDTVSLLKTNNQIIEKSLIELMITTDDTRNKDLLTDIEKRLTEIEKILASYQTNNTKELETLDKISALSDEIGKSFPNILELSASNQNEEAYEIYVTTTGPILRQIDDNFTNLIQINRDDAKSVNEQNKSDVHSSIILIISITILSLVLFGLVSWIISALIVKPVKQMESLMKQAENGDLSVQSTYQSKDEIGFLSQSFNNMLRQLNEVISKIQLASSQVAASSEQLMTSAEETNRASEHIAEASTVLSTSAETSVRETENASTAVQEMAMGINHITESISLVSEHSNTTTAESEKGNISLKKTIDQMDSINKTVLSSSSIIKDLGERSKEIENIVAMISGISNQTNLLALNAAIEAARAGEHGKGFAVVADEVRKLAEESNRSAEQITHLIQEVQNNTLNAVDAMDKCMQEMKTGLELINETGTSFNHILQSATDVSKQSEEVTAAAEEMSASVEQTAYGILEISKNAETSASTSQTVAAGTEEQLASMEEITASAHTLAKMAEELQTMVSMFKIK